MLLMDKYADKIYGTITALTVLIIQGIFPDGAMPKGIDRLPECHTNIPVIFLIFSNFLPAPLQNRFVQTPSVIAG